MAERDTWRDAPLSGDSLWVPGAGGTLFRVSKVTGQSVARVNPFSGLDASRLVLVKPADDLAEPVDPAFAGVVPAGLPVSIVGWQRLEAALLS